MSIKLRILNSAENETISAEVDAGDSVGDVLLFASEYWKGQSYAMVMKIGNRLVSPSVSVAEAGLKDGDTVTVVPDPQGG